MIVRDWIARQTAAAPKSLVAEVMRALGADAEAEASRTSDVCLGAAARGLDSLVANQRFKREHALELLTIDALMTFAYEHASQADDAAVERLIDRGTSMLGQLVTARV